MSETRGTLERLAGELTRLLSPLTSLTPQGAPAFFAELGIGLGEAQVTALAPSLTQTVSAIAALADANFELEASIQADDTGLVAQTRVVALQRIADVISGFAQLQAALAGLGLPDAAPIVADLPRRLFGLLLARYLGRSAGVIELLELAGILVRTDHHVAVFDPSKPFHTTNEFHFGRIGGWLRDPAKQLDELFGWGTPGFDAKKLLLLLDRIAGESGLPSLLDTSGAVPTLDLLFVGLSGRPELAPPGVDLSFTYGLSKGAVEFGPQRWTTRLELDTPVLADTRLVMQPGALKVEPPEATTLVGRATLGYTYAADGRPITLLSLLGLVSITIQEIGASFALEFRADRTVGAALGAQLRRGTVRVGTAEGDGFIRKIVGGGALESRFDVGLAYSLADGLRFHGSGALEIQLASHATLGPIALRAVTLAVGVKGNEFPAAVTAELATMLGPLEALVRGLGVEVAVSLREDNKGNLGPLDIKPRFRPPTGIGLALDAGGFRGGGSLDIDVPNGRYAGTLELDFQGLVTVKAVGILDTRLPNGADGFSLLILISAEFVPIQLSFGFTLIGVGGLLGLNRTVVHEVLRAGVHDGSLDSVLFPRDLASNAPRIIRDLQRIFPPLEGRFLIGPMARLGWGTPTMISLELGLLLEIPRPAFAILGILRVGVPAEDAPLIKLQVNFVGIVDFESGQLSFDASLVDSRMLAFTLTGDMAVRLYTGDNANFLVTVGGFHPAYTPPPMGLPPMQRLAIDMFAGLPRIRAEAYFAITSNTVQFGARVELYAGVDVFNVYGFLALDVLIHMNPFHFVAEFSAMLAVRSDTHVLMGVRVDGVLEGPTPWHARGTGSFRVGFVIKVRLSVQFDVTVGDDRIVALPPIDVFGELAKAVENIGHWRAVLPAGSHNAVSLRETPVAANTLVVHPFGTLEISQKVVPLNLPIQRLGSQRPANTRPAGTRYRVSEVKLGAVAAPTTAAKEQFAPAQFFDMSDAHKLSAQSFARYESGVRVGAGDRPYADYQVGLDVGYEVKYLPERRPGLRHWLREFIFTSLLKGCAAAQSARSFERTSPSGLGTPKVTLQAEQFAVASTTDLSLHAEDMVFESEAEARVAMQQVVLRRPDLGREVQVVPLYEVSRR